MQELPYELVHIILECADSLVSCLVCSLWHKLTRDIAISENTFIQAVVDDYAAVLRCVLCKGVLTAKPLSLNDVYRVAIDKSSTNVLELFVEIGYTPIFENCKDIISRLDYMGFTHRTNDSETPRENDLEMLGWIMDHLTHSERSQLVTYAYVKGSLDVMKMCGERDYSTYNMQQYKMGPSRVGPSIAQWLRDSPCSAIQMKDQTRRFHDMDDMIAPSTLHNVAYSTFDRATWWIIDEKAMFRKSCQ